MSTTKSKQVRLNAHHHRPHATPFVLAPLVVLAGERHPATSLTTLLALWPSPRHRIHRRAASKHVWPAGFSHVCQHWQDGHQHLPSQRQVERHCLRVVQAMQQVQWRARVGLRPQEERKGVGRRPAADDAELSACVQGAHGVCARARAAAARRGMFRGQIQSIGVDVVAITALLCVDQITRSSNSVKDGLILLIRLGVACKSLCPRPRAADQNAVKPVCQVVVWHRWRWVRRHGPLVQQRPPPGAAVRPAPGPLRHQLQLFQAPDQLLDHHHALARRKREDGGGRSHCSVHLISPAVCLHTAPPTPTHPAARALPLRAVPTRRAPEARCMVCAWPGSGAGAHRGWKTSGVERLQHWLPPVHSGCPSGRGRTCRR